MKNTRVLVFALFWCGCGILSAQSLDSLKRQVAAFRTAASITIDGVLSEPDWAQAPAAADFIQHQPVFKAAPAQRTEVKILYDNTGLYLGIRCYDSHPDSILQELSQRDNLGNTDWIGIFIDTYRDGINGVGFIVTPANVQFDAKYSTFGEDESWDAVWQSKTQLTPDGWVAEIKIPYAAIRFPKTDNQTWHINFMRMIRRQQERSTWNPLDPQLNGFLNQSGYLTNIQNIKSPVRLQATPFVAAYGEMYHDRKQSPKNSYGRSVTGGMDVKYGISDAFTLDMTLIPDFAQAQSDNQVLNLSPFEVQFNENRQFFTEGTELFNKGNLFYSRRIGGTPLNYSKAYANLQEGETVVKNPANSQLYNATKISGRTAKGLGIGFFNATSGETFATIRNAEGAERRVQTDPLTNFNVLVFDQNLKNNSFVTLINTTVLRNGSDYDANVTGGVFNLRDKKNAYAVEGNVVLSQKYFTTNTNLGHSYRLRLRKTSGPLFAGIGFNEVSDTYDPRDLGFLNNNNNQNAFIYAEYNQAKPFWKFNRGGIGMEHSYERLYRPSEFSGYGLNFYAYGQTKGFWELNVFTYHEPFVTYDFFEPRTPGRFYRFPTSNNYGFYVGTDSRKKLRFTVNSNFRNFSETGRHRLNIFFSPRYRVNDKLNFQLTFSPSWSNREVGYVNAFTPEAATEKSVIFGTRDRTTIELNLTSNYTFNENMALSFRMRHYWSKAEYERFNLLAADGTLAATDYLRNHDTDYDAFNIDMIYRWRFAPGSDLFIVWKNSIYEFEDRVQVNYFRNWDQLLKAPQSNSLSIKLIYFLDYNNLVRRKG
jgi:hypothetical protein